MNEPTHRRFGARLPLAAMLLFALACALSAAQASAAGVNPPTGPTATLTQCVAAVEALDRSATFSGQMSAIPGTARMAVRIDLQERPSAEASFRTLSAPGLGVWRSSQAGVRNYKFLRQVTDLPAPGEFRALVGFHWLDGKGRLIRRATKRTPTCEQPDERPKVTTSALAGARRGSASAEYQVTLHNEGRGSTGVFTLALSIEGNAQPALEVPSVEAQTSVVVAVSAPPCASRSEVEVSVDPQHHIEEAPGGGVPHKFPCPLAGQPGS